MRRFAFTVFWAGALLFPFANRVCADNWPQFRGPNASGRVEHDQPLPDRIGPADNIIWKTPLPPGHSSPAVHGDWVFLTGVREGKLLTLGLEGATGDVVWEAEAPYETLEAVHSAASRATPSPTTDGERVVSFFGSCGLFCYTTTGKFLWSVPMGPFKNDFGAGSSPIIVDDKVILCQDHDTDSFIRAYNKQTGELVWSTDRSEFPRNYCTPVVWEVDGRKQLVVAATLRIVGYDLTTGAEVWTVRGVARIVNMTPVIRDDNTLIAACWAPGGDATDRISTAPFGEMIAEHDTNQNGALELDEVPEGQVKMRFTQIDRDKDGQITRTEYDSMRQVFEGAHNAVVAIKPGGQGDITGTHVLWKYTKTIPYCPSPVWYAGRLYMVKSGGILSIVDAGTGKQLKEGRVQGTGEYFASPVVGDGRVYLLNQRGDLTVIAADAQGTELYTSPFGEDAYASPAIADGRIYLRTNGHLYCFGVPSAR